MRTTGSGSCEIMTWRDGVGSSGDEKMNRPSGEAAWQGGEEAGAHETGFGVAHIGIADKTSKTMRLVSSGIELGLRRGVWAAGRDFQSSC